MNSKILSQEEAIIELIDGEACISHKIVAKFSEIKEKSILDLITKYSSDFEEFGQLRFKIATVRNSVGAVNEEKTYFSNEPQSTLLMTYLRNTEKVKTFKKKLVRDFFKMRKQLQISKPTTNENLISVSTENMRKEFEALHFAFASFKMSENEKRILTNKVFEKLNFPTLETQPKRKSEPVFTLTQLLEDFQISFSPHEINLKLQSFGIIQRVGGYWFLENLKFGVNESYDNYKNPKYYKSTFQELLNIVL